MGEDGNFYRSKDEEHHFHKLVISTFGLKNKRLSYEQYAMNR